MFKTILFYLIFLTMYFIDFVLFGLITFLKKSYITLEWCKNSPPKPYAFPSLPIQSKLEVKWKNIILLSQSIFNFLRKSLPKDVIVNAIIIALFGYITKSMVYYYCDTNVFVNYTEIISLSYYLLFSVFIMFIKKNYITRKEFIVGVLTTFITALLFRFIINSCIDVFVEHVDITYTTSGLIVIFSSSATLILINTLSNLNLESSPIRYFYYLIEEVINRHFILKIPAEGYTKNCDLLDKLNKVEGKSIKGMTVLNMNDNPNITGSSTNNNNSGTSSDPPLAELTTQQALEDLNRDSRNWDPSREFALHLQRLVKYEANASTVDSQINVQAQLNKEASELENSSLGLLYQNITKFKEGTLYWERKVSNVTAKGLHILRQLDLIDYVLSNSKVGEIRIGKMSNHEDFSDVFNREFPREVRQSIERKVSEGQQLSTNYLHRKTAYLQATGGKKDLNWTKGVLKKDTESLDIRMKATMKFFNRPNK